MRKERCPVKFVLAFNPDSNGHVLATNGSAVIYRRRNGTYFFRFGAYGEITCTLDPDGRGFTVKVTPPLYQRLFNRLPMAVTA